MRGDKPTVAIYAAVVRPQIFISGYMPQPAFAAVVAVVAAAVAVNGAKVTGRLDASQGGRDIWQLWQECLGLFGLVLLPQVLPATVAPGMDPCHDPWQKGYPPHCSSLTVPLL